MWQTRELDSFRDYIKNYDTQQSKRKDALYKELVLRGSEKEARKLVGYLFNQNLVVETLEYYMNMGEIDRVAQNITQVANSMRENNDFNGGYINSLIYTIRGVRGVYPDDVALQVAMIFKYRIHEYTHLNPVLVRDNTIKHNIVLAKQLEEELKEDYELDDTYTKQVANYLRLQYLHFPKLQQHDSVSKYIEEGISGYTDTDSYIRDLEKVLVGNSALKERKVCSKPAIELSYYSTRLLQKATQAVRNRVSTDFTIPRSVIHYIVNKVGVEYRDIVLDGIREKGILDKYLIDRLISEVS